MNRDPAWRPVAPDAIASRLWDDELVVYNDVTGSTHHLSVLGSDVMRTLLEHPAGMALVALVDRIANAAGTGADRQLSNAIERTLADLAQLRLVERVTA